MTNKVSIYRQKLQLTQSELAEKSGVSLRTIQRIESGSPLKGFTLKNLAKSLDITPEDLIEIPKAEAPENWSLDKAKLINITALSFIILPFGNIIFPSILTFRNSGAETKKIGREIIGFQIVWTIINSFLLIISPFVQKLLSTKIPIILVVLLVSLLTNTYIIIRNSIELNKNQRLYISLKNNIL